MARRYSEFEKLHEALAKAWGKQAHRAPRTKGQGGGGGGGGGGRDTKPALSTATP